MKTSLFTLLFFLLLFSCRSADTDSQEQAFKINEKFDFQGMKIVAHRGVWNYLGGVENSMSSFLKFMNSDVHGMEFDIRMSKDSVLFVHHDSVINNYIIELTNSDVLKSQKISPFEEICTLESILKIFGSNSTKVLYFDVKESYNADYNKRIIKRLLSLMNQYSLSYSNKIMAADRSMFRTLNDNNCSYTTVLLTSAKNFNAETFSLENIKEVAVSLALYESQPDLMQELKNKKINIHIWTVNDFTKIKMLAGQNVYSVITDFPLQIMEHYK